VLAFIAGLTLVAAAMPAPLSSATHTSDPSLGQVTPLAMQCMLGLGQNVVTMIVFLLPFCLSLCLTPQRADARAQRQPWFCLGLSRDVALVTIVCSPLCC
jgi:hypothetical protein